MAGRSIIVMGVSGSGKSSIGEAIAAKLGYKFIDGDDLHPRANIDKMHGGDPLNDDDRRPWLERIGDAAYSLEMKNEVGIIVCSALKKRYRDQIRKGNSSVQFLLLHGSFDVILERMKARKGHFMADAMLKSQFDTLELPKPDEGVIQVDISGNMEQVIALSIKALTT